MSSPAVIAYGMAALAFFGFALQLGARWRGSREASSIFATVVLSGLWCGASAAAVLADSAALWWLARLADACRYAALAIFIGRVLARSPDPNATSRGRGVAVVVAAALPLAMLAFEFVMRTPDSRGQAFIGWLALAVAGLAATEQMYRRTVAAWRWNQRPLCLALVCFFGYDLVLYSTAALFRSIDGTLWSARGIVHAFAIPLLGLAAARNRDWTFDVAVSRGVLLGTASLFVAGGYLVVIALVGYVLRYTSATWAGALQVVLASAAVLALALVLLSGTFRSRLRVFIAKHFYSYRYDYRSEWLRFTQTLAGSGGKENLSQRCVRALGDLVESGGGALWLHRPPEGFVQVASLSLPQPPGPLGGEAPLPRFLRETGWIVDLAHAEREPAAYPGLVLPAWLTAMPGAWLLVPLMAGDDLIGFVVLTTPRVRFDLDWEVIDLLKTAGRGAASYLAQAQATEALLEARKFDAFNRMSAFVVHDLKNLVAQLQLLLRNVARHGSKPEFQRDMLATVEHVAGRMTQLMQQLRTGAEPVLAPQPLHIGQLVEGLKRTHALGSRIDLEVDGDIVALGHPDRLERVIGHLVQNALDASPEGRTVRVRVRRGDARVRVEVIDQGAGMTAEFVRDELFKPFRSTKPGGMGLGAFESQQYVHSLGGRLHVDSAPGRGTTVTLELAAVDAAVEAAA